MYAHQNILGDHPQIPEEAFLFVPKRSEDPKVRDDYRIGDGKGMRRLIMEGWAQETYTKYQIQRLKQLDDYLVQKGIKLDSRWDRSWRLRWYMSTGCNLKKCIDDIKIFNEYQDRVKNLTLSPTVAKYLHAGIYYLAGRDSHYRPIMVFDVEKIIKLDMTEDEILETQTFFFQYILNHMLIPGQVENWIVIIDAASTGVFSLVGTMKKSFTFLSDTYRSRMFVCYVCRVPSSISFLWGIVKKFIDQETVRKINFFDDQIVEPLLQFCSPSQLEVKFGGTLPNIQEGQFWPPREVSSNYKCQKQPVRLLSRQQYTEYYNKKIFYNTKFHIENIIAPKTATDLRDNNQAHIIRKLERQFKMVLSTAQQQSVDLLTPTEKHISPPLTYLSLIKAVKEKKQKTQISEPNEKVK